MIEDLRNLIDSEKETLDLIKKSEGLKRDEYISSLKILNEKMPSLLKDSSLEEVPQKVVSDLMPKSSNLIKISNILFRRKSERLSPHFENLERNLKKANIGHGLISYLSMTFFVTMLSFIFSFIIFGLLVSSGVLSWVHIWIPIFSILLVYFLFMFSPSSQAKDIQKEIDYELPFSTLHMAAISSSGIEPVKLFSIISESDEYPSIAKEIKKILVQVKVYGYDLVTSLRNVAGRTSNKKLAELLNGMATNISSGGSLRTYLEKKSDSFLLDYQLERKRYIEMSGTFMDIYISILIAAPLILMLLFIVMSVADLNAGGLSLSVLLFLTVGIVALFNILFIIVLNFKQPKI